MWGGVGGRRRLRERGPSVFWGVRDGRSGVVRGKVASRGFGRSEKALHGVVGGREGRAREAVGRGSFGVAGSLEAVEEWLWRGWL